MSVPDPEFLERIRRQFDHCPYPSTPLEYSYGDKPDSLYVHNMMTAFYRCRHLVTNAAGKLILDAGCGTGLKALGLAQANPGARIVGVDISSESIDFAKKRLQYYGFDNTEFHVLALEDLDQLGMQFDYINCDEVLYLLHDQVAGLAAMRSVLKPEGIIRVNLHSVYGRGMILRSQEAFQRMGLLDSNPEETEIQIVRDTFEAMKDSTMIKQLTNWAGVDKSNEAILANHLLVGDRGFSVPQFFDFLKKARLDFFSMVEWEKWDIYHLFKDPENLPLFWEMTLPEASLEDQLTLVELFNPVNRLLDLWCGHIDSAPILSPVSSWSDQDWQSAIVYLHPQLNTEPLKTELYRCIELFHPFDISRFLPNFGRSSLVDATIASAILPPLLDQPHSMDALVQRWQQIHPLDPINLEPTSPQSAFKLVKGALETLESGNYVLISS